MKAVKECSKNNEVMKPLFEMIGEFDGLLEQLVFDMQQLQKDDVGRVLKIKNEESIFKIEQNLNIIEYDIKIFKIREVKQ